VSLIKIKSGTFSEVNVNFNLHRTSITNTDESDVYSKKLIKYWKNTELSL